MYLNDFSVRIPGKKETSGYVELNHGETYSINIKNSRSVRCEAVITIDGKDMGTLLLKPYESVNLERPINEAKKFTFYRINSQEAADSGLNKVDNDELGLISVEFKPEKKVEPVVIHHYHPYVPPTPPPYQPWPWRPYEPHWYTTTWCTTDNTLKGTVTSNSVLYRSATDGTGGASSRSKGVQSASCNFLSAQSVDSADLGLMDDDAVEGLVANRAGGTGLSAESNQGFRTVTGISEYDYDSFTTIHLRLVLPKKERSRPTELKPVTRTTPIPPPVWII
jgi:hypothetical protein